ncbi:hypothetical protein FF36_03884 [Frankia torreyi]|uniref:SnoaL-like domain n=1 Tax=Frankia torreyi TaxID=1856 RepID=A0A0D8BCD2_9ACTN|nr:MULTISPECIES: hypothetical protein [Frankia]KJE21831.1 hypothetical protein FF36_03884 [Frankia torreyi]
MSHSREEVEAAFKNYYLLGPVAEDWKRWAHECFTEDAWYKDHYWGTFNGQDEIEEYLDVTMSWSPGTYTPMIWYKIDGDTVVWKGINWADNYKVPGGPKVGAESIQILEYAGNGQFKSEEDYWIAYEMKRFGKWYAEFGQPYTPGDIKLTRDDWGTWVDWARPEPGHVPRPSWVDRPGLKPTFNVKEIGFGVRNPTIDDPIE